MTHWRLSRRGLITAAVLFVSGLLLGAFGYALVGPYRKAVDPQVQNGLVLAMGAVVAGLLAAVGAYWAAAIAASVVSSEGEATRRETRRFALIDRKTDIVRKIIVFANRHARSVDASVIFRQDYAGQVVELGWPLPRPENWRIEDLINELYTLGFQATADVGAQLLNTLYQLNRFAYVPTAKEEPIAGLPDDEYLSYLAWLSTQIRVKTHMIEVSLTDEGTTHLGTGTLPEDYLDRQYRSAAEDVRRERHHDT